MESLPYQYQKRPFWEFYCPVCKVLRRSFYWPNPRIKHYMGLGAIAVFFTVAFWRWFDFKGAFLVLPIWILFEFIYRARARQTLICPHCGFDPYLYKFDVKLARKRVEDFFEARNKKLERPSESEKPKD